MGKRHEANEATNTSNTQESQVNTPAPQDSVPSAVDQGIATTVSTTAPAATVAAGVPDERFRKIKDPSTGNVMNRKDFILMLADQGKSRAEITKTIKGIPVADGGNPTFKYQIVFQATKHLDKTKYPKLNGGFKPKEVPVTVAAATPAPEASVGTTSTTG